MATALPMAKAQSMAKAAATTKALAVVVLLALAVALAMTKATITALALEHVDEKRKVLRNDISKLCVRGLFVQSASSLH